jgi:hypothetical protein
MTLFTTLLITLNSGKITYNDITYYRFYFEITLPITASKKHMCNVTFINVKMLQCYNVIMLFAKYL